MTNPRPQRQWLSVDQVATILVVSRMTVYRLINGTPTQEPQLPAYRIGRSIRVDVRDIQPYLDRARIGGVA